MRLIKFIRRYGFKFFKTFVSKDLPMDKKDKTIANKLMYIPKDDTQNYPFCRLMVETFEN